MAEGVAVPVGAQGHCDRDDRPITGLSTIAMEIYSLCHADEMDTSVSATAEPADCPAPTNYREMADARDRRNQGVCQRPFLVSSLRSLEGVV